MAALSKILRTAGPGRVAFRCPACDMAHTVNVNGPGDHWEWNGDAERPTFSPSIRVRGTQRLSEEQYRMLLRGQAFEPEPLYCHFFVQDGMIGFLSDCLHELAGQTVPIPLWWNEVAAVGET